VKQASPPAGGFRSIADTTLVEGGTAKGNNDDGSPVSETWRPTMMRYAPMLALERFSHWRSPRPTRVRGRSPASGAVTH